MHSGERWRLGHRPGLDGLRGIAIGLVLLGHATHGWLTNFGSTGVTVFFALSGFLITALLLEDRGRHGRVSLGRFYQRRARRLLPALAMYLAFWSVLAALGVGIFAMPLGQVLGAVFYMSNWMMVSDVAMSTPLSITWSLSVEEQFYLVWPLLLIVSSRWRRGPMVVAALGVLYAVVVRVVLWDPEQAKALYYRSDTRMDSLLVGCLLALTVTRFGVPAWCRRAWVPGAVAICVLLAWPSAWLHFVAEPVLVAAATVAVIVGLLAGGGAWLSVAPLRWLGRRSYALYLWHYPLIVLSWAGLMPLWLSLTLAFAAAETSWWLVERPLRARSQATRNQSRATFAAAVAPPPAPYSLPNPT